jgi:ABC-type sugar transport system substrate-binding protein
MSMPRGRFVQRILNPLLLAVCALAFSIDVMAAEQPLRVGFLAGGSQSSEFWGEMGRFAAAVAEDLNIDLRIAYTAEGTLEKDGQALLDQLNERAYFVTAYVDPISGRLLETADRRGIRTVLINTDILAADRERIGKPREKLHHWIGHMQPDDVQAGFEVADMLLGNFDRAAEINLIAINGNDNLASDADRRAGLEQRLAQSPGVTLYETREGRWSEATARAVTIDLLRKYPDTHAIWTASDSMALGAIEAVRELGKQPGKDVVVAGVDWTSRGLDAAAAGEMRGSVGGHYMEAGLALLLIYDYHHGRDFASDLGVSFRTSMTAILHDDIERRFRKLGRTPDWSRIDFKPLTKTHNPQLKRYDFSWERIFEPL